MADVKPQIEKLFAGLARKNDTLRKTVPAKVSMGEKRATFVDRVSQPRVSMVWRVPKIGSDDYLKLDVVTTILQNRINEQLLDEGIASDAYAYVQGGILESQVNFTAFPGEGVSLSALEQKMNAMLQEFQQKGVTAAELSTAIAATEKNLLGGMQELVGRAQTMNIDAYYYGNPNYTLQSLEKYKKLNINAVVASSRTFLPSNDRLILTVLPASPSTDATTRDTRPSDASSAAFAFPKNTEFKLSNGIPVSYWQSGQFPMTYLGVSSSQGTGSESVLGSTQLLAGLLDKGSKTKNFSRVLSSLGADLSTSADVKQLSINSKTLSRNLEPSLKLLTEAIASPLLTQDEFENERAGLNFERESLPDDPRRLSLEIAMNAFHGASHPMGRFVSPAQVKKLTLDQVRNRYREIINPANLKIFMAGDLSVQQVRSILEKTIGAWKGTGATKAMLPMPAPSLSKARLLIVDRPDSPQTFVRVFTPSIGYNSNYLEYATLGTVLGGTFTSRLMSNLREDKGYTYGIGSSFIFENTYGILNTRSAVDSTVTGESIKEILKEFKLISEQGITDAETQKAVQSQLSGIYDSLATPEYIVFSASSLSAEGRSFANLAAESAALGRISTASVNAIAKNAIQLENAIWVLVGDKKTIVPQLEGLGLPVPEDVVPQ